MNYDVFFLFDLFFKAKKVENRNWLRCFFVFSIQPVGVLAGNGPPALPAELLEKPPRCSGGNSRLIDKASNQGYIENPFYSAYKGRCHNGLQ
jgi:hypothetical protein